jgi:beta-1,4-mannosyl-glycoprotein beta-1,4-N-acetylglucosaminyltransferase
MIYSACLYNGEKDLLEIQLEELRGLDVTHVIVEASHTFSGKEKEMLFDESDPYYSQFSIEYIPVFDMPNNGNPWANEAHARNAILRGLSEASEDDIVILRDCDEVVMKSAIWDYDGTFARLVMNKCGYYLNCIEGYQTWNRAMIMKCGYLDGKLPEDVRNSGCDDVVPNAGWHWSFCGGVDAILKKFGDFSHQEPEVQKHANRDLLEYKVMTGQSMWAQDFWKFIPIDNTFPEYVVKNQDKLSHLIRQDINDEQCN